MRLYYWRSTHGNFGDDMNELLFRHFMPGCFEPGVGDDVLVLGIGTILWEGAPKARRRIVLGSGAGYGCLPNDLGDPSWDFVAVRGPLTAAAVGRAPHVAVTDPAVLLPRIPELLPTSKQGVAFVPHWETALGGGWRAACELAGVTYIDPRGEARDVIRRIASAELVIAESLHGAIVADAYRSPWIAAVSARDTPFKWHDWTRSLELDYRPVLLGNLASPARALRERVRGRTPAIRRLDAQEPERELEQLRARAPSSRAAPRSAPIMRALKATADRCASSIFDAERLAEEGARRLELARQLMPTLSDDALLRARQECLLERMEAVTAEYVGRGARVLPAREEPGPESVLEPEVTHA